MVTRKEKVGKGGRKRREGGRKRRDGGESEGGLMDGLIDG